MQAEASPVPTVPRWSKTLATTAALTAMATAIGLSIVAIRHEQQVQAARALMDRQASWGDDAPIKALSGIAPDAPPRAQLIHSLYLARGAERLEAGPERERLLRDADREADFALHSRPKWGEAWIIKAFIGYVRAGSADTYVLDALSRSYAEAPFQREAGLWRVRTGLANWDRFSPRTQDCIVAEVTWLLHISPLHTRQILFADVRQSPAYERIFYRWHLFEASERRAAR